MISSHEFNKMIRPIFAAIADGDNTILSKKGMDIINERVQNKEDFLKNCQRIDELVEGTLHKLNKMIEQKIDEGVSQKLIEIREEVKRRTYLGNYSANVPISEIENVRGAAEMMKEYSVAQLLLAEKIKEMMK